MFSKCFVQGVGVARLIASKKKVRPHSSSWQGCVPWLPWRAGCVSHELMIGSPRLWSIPRKFNVAPKNRQSQKEAHLPTIIFQGRTVKFRGCIRFFDWNMIHDLYSWWFFTDVSLFKKILQVFLGSMILCDYWKICVFHRLKPQQVDVDKNGWKHIWFKNQWGLCWPLKKNTTLILLSIQNAWEFGTSLFFLKFGASEFSRWFSETSKVHICGMPRRLSGLDVNPAKNAGGYKRQPSGG